MVDEVAVTAGSVKCVLLSQCGPRCNPVPLHSYNCIVDPGVYLIQLLTLHSVP